MEAPPSYVSHMQGSNGSNTVNYGDKPQNIVTDDSYNVRDDDYIGKPGAYAGLVTGQSSSGAMLDFWMARKTFQYPWGLNLVTEKVHGRTNWYITNPEAKSIAEYTGLGVLCPPGCALLIWAVNDKDCGTWSRREDWDLHIGRACELKLSLLPCTVDVVRRIIYWEKTHRAKNGTLFHYYQKHIDQRRKVRGQTSQNPMQKQW